MMNYHKDTHFRLHMTAAHSSKRCSFDVEVIYQCEQYEKYKINGGGKEMILQKNIGSFHSWKDWKVLDVNFEIQQLDDRTIETLHDLFKMIDNKRFDRVLYNYWRKTSVEY